MTAKNNLNKAPPGRNPVSIGSANNGPLSGIPAAGGRGLNSNTLKNIAIIAMFFDHLFSVFIPFGTPLWVLLRIPGRVVMPIMCYQIAGGFSYTSNLKKYAGRLLVFAMISHLPYDLYFKENIWFKTSAMWGLFLGLAALAAVKKTNWHIALKIAAVVLLCIMAWPADWKYVSVLWVLFFGLFHGRRDLQMLSFALVGIFGHIIPRIIQGGLPYVYEIGIFIAVPLLLLYNGKQGKKSKFIKWGFYVFYPLHLILLYIIRIITGI